MEGHIADFDAKAGATPVAFAPGRASLGKPAGEPVAASDNDFGKWWPLTFDRRTDCVAPLFVD